MISLIAGLLYGAVTAPLLVNYSQLKYKGKLKQWDYTEQSLECLQSLALCLDLVPVFWLWYLKLENVCSHHLLWADKHVWTTVSPKNTHIKKRSFIQIAKTKINKI